MSCTFLLADLLTSFHYLFHIYTCGEIGTHACWSLWKWSVYTKQLYAMMSEMYEWFTILQLFLCQTIVKMFVYWLICSLAQTPHIRKHNSNNNSTNSSSKSTGRNLFADLNGSWAKQNVHKHKKMRLVPKKYVLELWLFAFEHCLPCYRSCSNLVFDSIAMFVYMHVIKYLS